MRVLPDQFYDRLRDRLNAIEARLDSVKADIRSLPWNARKALQRKLVDARTKLGALKERVEQTRTELVFPPPFATELSADSVSGWREKPDMRKPDAAAVYVSASIDYAVAGIDEVGDAMLFAAASQLHDAGRSNGSLSDATAADSRSRLDRNWSAVVGPPSARRSP